MGTQKSFIIEHVREELRPAPLRLLEAFLALVPAEALGAAATAMHAAKAEVLNRLAEMEGGGRVSDLTLRQRIADLNKAAKEVARRRGATAPAFEMKSAKAALTLSLDAAQSSGRTADATRDQLKRSIIEDVPRDSAILQTPRVNDDIAAKKYRVFVSHAWDIPNTERVLDSFLGDLRHQLANLPPKYAYNVELWIDRTDLPHTTGTFDGATVPAAKASHVGLFILTDKWYGSAACKAEARCFHAERGDYDFSHIIKLQLSGRRQDGDAKLVSGPVLPESYCKSNIGNVPPAENLLEYWCKADESQKAKFVLEVRRLILEIIDDLKPVPPPPPSVEDQRTRFARQAARIPDHDDVVRAGTAQPARATRNEESDDAVELLPLLENWARGGTKKEPATQRVVALLGSFGSGKTIATQMFARRLHDLREKGKKIPFPVYLDFRRLVGTLGKSGANPSLQQIIATSLSDKVGPIDGEAVVTILRGEPCVILFDGLDEIGTALGVERTSQLYRQLLEIVPSDAWDRDAQVGKADWSACQIRIMVTCRTHFFRNVMQERKTFSGHDRASARPDAATTGLLQTFHMAPFTPEQIEKFFIAALGDVKGRELFTAVGHIASLEDLAKKPVMTQFVAELSTELMADHAAGRPINAAALYEHLFNAALERDGHKATAMGVRHRLRLLQELALHFWENNSTGMRVVRLEEWLDDYIAKTPTMKLLEAREGALEILQTELRNASLLVRRNDDEFRFVHTSFHEYFLALGLKDRLLSGGFAGVSANAIVNTETRGFLLDCAARENEVDRLGRSLASLLRGEAGTATRQFALELLELGRARDYRWALPSEANLSGLDLRDWIIGPAHHGAGILFDGTDLAGANLFGARLRRVTLRNCNMDGTVFWGAQLDGCVFAGCGGVPIGAGSLRLNDCLVDESTRAATLRDIIFEFRKGPGGGAARQAMRIGGSATEISSAVFSPEGDAILTASWDNTARLFDRATGQERARYTGHESAVNSAVFSPEGDAILTASRDGTARLFDRATGQERAFYTGHESEVNSAVFSPEGDAILTASQDGTARLFDRATGQERACYIGHESEVNSAVFSLEGDAILTASRDGTARLFDRATGQERARYTGHESAVNSAVFSPEGDAILTASWDNTARLFDRATGQERARYTGHNDWVTSAVFSPEGDAILTASHDGTARLFDRATGLERARYTGHTRPVTSAVFLPEGDAILTASWDNTARLFDRATGQERARYTGHENAVNSAVFSPEGDAILTASRDGTARLFDRATGQERARYTGHESAVNSAVFSPEGDAILTASCDNTARLFDRATGLERARYTGHNDWVTSAVFSPEGDAILTASHDGTARLFDRATGLERARYTGHTRPVTSAVFLPEGDAILTASWDNTARLFDRATGQERARYTGHENAVNSAVFSPEGDAILTASRDGTARLFDRATGQERARYTGHESAVNSAVFSPEGDAILTASCDNTARLFDRATGLERARYTGHENWVNSAVFSPEGDAILTASEDGTARLFDRVTARCRGQIALLPDDHAICDPYGQVLSIGANGWKYIYGLTTGADGPPKICCPPFIPVNEQIPLFENA